MIASRISMVAAKQQPTSFKLLLLNAGILCQQTVATSLSKHSHKQGPIEPCLQACLASGYSSNPHQSQPKSSCPAQHQGHPYQWVLPCGAALASKGFPVLTSWESACSSKTSCKPCTGLLCP